MIGSVLRNPRGGTSSTGRRYDGIDNGNGGMGTLGPQCLQRRTAGVAATDNDKVVARRRRLFIVVGGGRGGESSSSSVSFAGALLRRLADHLLLLLLLPLFDRFVLRLTRAMVCRQ